MALPQVEICWGPDRQCNRRAAIQLGRQLEEKGEISKFALKQFPSLRQMFTHVKAENSIFTIGLSPFYDNVKGIIPAGMDFLEDYKLFISGAIKLFLCRGNIKKRIPSRKDFLVVSSITRSEASSAPEQDRDYATLAIIEKVKNSDISTIKRLMSELGILFYEHKFESSRGNFYLKINHHPSKISHEAFKQFPIKILGSYEVSE